jgi:transcriptional regulator NrdR family protein
VAGLNGGLVKFVKLEGYSMLCPKCGNERILVAKKFSINDQADMRVRLCKDCQHVWVTKETIVYDESAKALACMDSQARTNTVKNDQIRAYDLRSSADVKK